MKFSFNEFHFSIVEVRVCLNHNSVELARTRLLPLNSDIFYIKRCVLRASVDGHNEVSGLASKPILYDQKALRSGKNGGCVPTTSS